MDRDLKILHEITRWRFLLSRQIRILCGFTSQRACDRRLAKLIEAGYITRKHYIYGVPRLYTVTPKSVKIFALDYFTPHIRIEQIPHDVATVDTGIHLIFHEGIDSASIITERELKHEAGFGSTNKHFPDLVYTKDNKTVCVEIELSAKKLTTLERNMKNNYKAFDFQLWFVPNDRPKVVANVKSIGKKYGVEITPLERVIEYVKN